jgi:hypothetical protein
MRIGVWKDDDISGFELQYLAIHQLDDGHAVGYQVVDHKMLGLGG